MEGRARITGRIQKQKLLMVHLHPDEDKLFSTVGNKLPPIPCEAFALLFDDSQVFYLEFVGSKWVSEGENYKWVTSLAGTSARWFIADVALRYKVVAVLNGGGRGTQGGGGDDGGGDGGKVVSLGLTRTGRMQKMNISSHVCTPDQKDPEESPGWVKFRGKRGLNIVLTSPQCVPELGPESMDALAVTACSGCMYGSMKYGPNSYGPRNFYGLARTLYGKRHRLEKVGTADLLRYFYVLLRLPLTLPLCTLYLCHLPPRP